MRGRPRTRVANYIQAIEQLTVTTLRNVIGGLDARKTLTSRDRSTAQLRGVLDEATGKWGIRVNRVELKAIDPPASMQESMEKQMKADREKRAVVLTAEGEKQSQILDRRGRKGSPRSSAPRANGRRRSSPRRDRRRRSRPSSRRSTTESPDAELLAYQYLQMLPQIAQGRREQGLDHPERAPTGGREDRRRRHEREREVADNPAPWRSSC